MQKQGKSKATPFTVKVMTTVPSNISFSTQDRRILRDKRCFSLFLNAKNI